MLVLFTINNAINAKIVYFSLVENTIIITDGEREYQPYEDKPIRVEINDPRLTKDKDLELWHIYDDGEKERIDSFTVEDGKLSLTVCSLYSTVRSKCLDLVFGVYYIVIEIMRERLLLIGPGRRYRDGVCFHHYRKKQK